MMADKSWHVYIVRCNDGSLYTGVAKDLHRRIAQHNAGRGARYTCSRRPVKLVYCETVPDHGTALRRELAIKRISAVAKRQLVKDAVITP